jgi:hypothetical protein
MTLLFRIPQSVYAMMFVPVFLFFTVIAEIRQGFCLENYPQSV